MEPTRPATTPPAPGRTAAVEAAPPRRVRRESAVLRPPLHHMVALADRERGEREGTITLTVPAWCEEPPHTGERP